MPANEDIEELKKELKKLRPREKVKKLKELEEKRKTEMTEIEDLIKDSEKELKTEKVAEEIAPKQLEINIGRLFEEEAGRLERTAKEGTRAAESREYMPFKQLYSDYAQLQSAVYASMTGPLTQTQLEVVDRIGERLDRTKYQSASSEVANILVASRSALYKIRKYAGLEGRSNF